MKIRMQRMDSASQTKGYHLEHNFGHGKKHLSSLLATMNLLRIGVSMRIGVRLLNVIIDRRENRGQAVKCYY
jgi:hypothetical protein